MKKKTHDLYERLKRIRSPYLVWVDAPWDPESVRIRVVLPSKTKLDPSDPASHIWWSHVRSRFANLRPSCYALRYRIGLSRLYRTPLALAQGVDGMKRHDKNMGLEILHIEPLE